MILIRILVKFFNDLMIIKLTHFLVDYANKVYFSYFYDVKKINYQI